MASLPERQWHVRVGAFVKLKTFHMMQPVVNFIDRVALKFGDHQLCPLNEETLFGSMSDEFKSNIREGSLKGPIQAFLKDCANDTVLSAMGRVVLKVDIQDNCRKIEQVVRYLKENPDLSQIPIVSPVFVINLMRTGSTFLHNLMGCDDQFTTPSMGDMLSPPWIVYQANKQSNHGQSTDEPLKFAAYINIMQKMMGACHFMTSETADEIMYLFFYAGILPEVLLGLPTFTEVHDWYYGASREEMVGLYRTVKSVLQLILSADESYKKQPRPLLLKHHLNMMHMDALLEVFPDASFVCAHRDPTEFLPSACSMQNMLAEVFVEEKEVMRKPMGQNLLHQMGHAANKYTWLRKSHMTGKNNNGKNTYIDCKFTDMIKDPMLTIRGVYTALGLQLTHDTEVKMTEYLNTKAQAIGKCKNHKYTAEQFGLTEEGIREHFKEYSDYFNV